MLRLKLTEYFDSVVNEIDLFTETRIQQDHRLEKWWNDRREEQIEAIRRIERTCLARDKRDQGNVESQGFVEYCFTFIYADMLFLAQANRYVTSQEQELLEAQLNWQNLSQYDQISKFVTNWNKERKLSSFQVDFACDIRLLLRSHLRIVDIDQWLDSCNQVSKIQISGAMDSIHFNTSFHVSEVKLKVDLSLFEDEGELVALVKSVVSSHENISNISINIGIFHNLSIKPETISSLRSLISTDSRVKLTIQCNQQTLDKIYSNNELHGESVQLDRFLKHAVRFYASRSWMAVTNWTFIESASLYCLPEHLEMSDLTGLVSLQELSLRLLADGSSKTNMSWHFLDPVRSSLVYYSLHLGDGISIEWKDFSGMTNLRELKLVSTAKDGDTGKEIVDRPEVFSDLINLKKLYISSYFNFYSTEWRCSLPALEECHLRVFSSRTSMKTKAEFIVPRVTKLGLSNESLSTDISSLVTCFSHVKRLEVNIEMVKSSLLNSFKSIEKLRLFKQTDSLDIEMPSDCSCLSELEIVFEGQRQKIEKCDMHQLTSLKSVAFYFDLRSQPFDLEDKSMFDGLDSLEQINYVAYGMSSNDKEARMPKSYKVEYFENIGRQVLIRHRNYSKYLDAINVEIRSIFFK